eukprot:UN2524
MAPGAMQPTASLHVLQCSSARSTDHALRRHSALVARVDVPLAASLVRVEEGHALVTDTTKEVGRHLGRHLAATRINVAPLLATPAWAVRAVAGRVPVLVPRRARRADIRKVAVVGPADVGRDGALRVRQLYALAQFVAGAGIGAGVASDV